MNELTISVCRKQLYEEILFWEASLEKHAADSKLNEDLWNNILKTVYVISSMNDSSYTVSLDQNFNLEWKYI